MISGRVKAFYREIVSSYAFLPGCYVVAGVIAGVVLTTLDTVFADSWINELPGAIGPGTATGARGILTTVGGSMLSVAGIVFSITLAAIVFASGQYGPHVLPQYRRDRFAQATLGTMLAVFSYAMAVLYTVQGGGEAFVPRLAVFGALILTGIGMVMLVLFISHMLGMLHVSNVIARIGGIAIDLLDREMPTDEPGAVEAIGHDAPFLTEEGDPVIRAAGTGYVLGEATSQLVRFAERYDLEIDLLVRPGDYVTPLTPIMRVRPTLPEDDDAENVLRSALAYGSKRTPDEDVAFMLDELCAIGLRALSPGVNDPFTATDVVNQLTAVTERAARGRPRDALWRDDQGTIRVRRPVLEFSDVVRLGFDRMATDAATNVTVMPVMMRAYDSLLSQRHDGPEVDRLLMSAQRFGSLCEALLPTDDAKREARTALSRIMSRASAERGPGELRLRRLKRESG